MTEAPRVALIAIVQILQTNGDNSRRLLPGAACAVHTGGNCVRGSYRVSDRNEALRINSPARLGLHRRNAHRRGSLLRHLDLRHELLVLLRAMLLLMLLHGHALRRHTSRHHGLGRHRGRGGHGGRCLILGGLLGGWARHAGVCWSSNVCVSG